MEEEKHNNLVKLIKQSNLEFSGLYSPSFQTSELLEGVKHLVKGDYNYDCNPLGRGGWIHPEFVEYLKEMLNDIREEK